MTLVYGSVCSGIEAATMAWHPFGWQPKFFSEIERFPSAVLAHHYGSNMPGEPLAKNGVPNLGDMTKFEEWPDYAIDLLVGGTPCQDYSIAGLRAGMDGVRGSLTLTYAAIARRYRPRWLGWENVPGVLSINGGRDFGSFLGLLAGRRIEVPAGGWKNSGIVEGYERAYGLAWRVLDAQYVRVDGYGRAVPQRRRRVFVVGYLGDWRRAAAVLLEPEGMRGDSPPRRKARQGVARKPALSVAIRGRDGGGMAELGDDVGLTLRAATGGSDKPHVLAAFGGGNTSGAIDVSTALTALTAHRHRIDFEVETFIAEGVAHARRGEGFDANEDGTGRGTPIVPVSYALQAGTLRENPNAGPDGVGIQQDHAYTLEARAEVQAVAFAHQAAGKQTTLGYSDDGTVQTLSTRQTPAIATQWAVRRLTPRECERLQGFPDDFTDVPWNGKATATDGPRYKALGNSMAVNVMRWIGWRIDLMERLIKSGRIA